MGKRSSYKSQRTLGAMYNIVKVVTWRTGARCIKTEVVLCAVVLASFLTLFLMEICYGARSMRC